jgi:hypothetical protein
MEPVPGITSIIIAGFLLLWVAGTAGMIIREKPERQREQALFGFQTGIGKMVGVVVGIQCILVLSLLVWSLSGK